MKQEERFVFSFFCSRFYCVFLNIFLRNFFSSFSSFSIALYKKFKDFSSRIMVATNLLGRGIDVERVNVVINYDMSDCKCLLLLFLKTSSLVTLNHRRQIRNPITAADTYLHRAGRAGRFGTKGLAISFISTKEDGEILNEGTKQKQKHHLYV